MNDDLGRFFEIENKINSMVERAYKSGKSLNSEVIDDFIWLLDKALIGIEAGAKSGSK